MSRMLSETPLFPGMGLSGGESGCVVPGFGKLCKESSPGTLRRLLMKAAGPSFTGNRCVGRLPGEGLFPLADFSSDCRRTAQFPFQRQPRADQEVNGRGGQQNGRDGKNAGQHGDDGGGSRFRRSDDGLPSPPVAAEAAPRMAAMPPWMMPAAPPPALAASPHLSMGSMLPMKPAARMVPATMAAGAPSTSSVWSMTGM